MPEPISTELPALGTLASSHPFHSQLLCDMPSPSLTYITTMPSDDHLLSQILVFPYHPSNTFALSLFQPLYPPVVACFFSSHAFEISDKWDFPSFSSFLSPSPAYLWANQPLPPHTSSLSPSFLPRTSVQSEPHSSSPEFWLCRGLVFSSPTSEGTSVLNSTGP